jgi:putative radical SAM enzyme (TIGR03279 family)
MVKIVAVEKNSPAFKAGIKKGESLISVNGNQIEDAIDFNYYCAEEPLSFSLDGKNGGYKVELSSAGSNGVEVEDLKIRHCGNKCVFCFIDQNPKGMRRTIYVKDEDYRFSFLYGNYFTLTNITQKELDRIVRMKLSPLYISVHSVNDEIRKKLLGIKKDDRLLEKMRYLTNNGIELNTQIVMCPGYNDGRVLEETVQTMRKFYPMVRSVAVVPVGLTSHRSDLPKIEPVTEKIAAETVKLILKLNRKYKKETGMGFVFPADEFFLKSGIELPDEDFYEDYLQYEDGVGMARNFIERFRESADLIPDRIEKKTSVNIVTGELFYQIMNKIVMPELKKVKNLTVRLVKVENILFGKSVTVAGLLGGKDIKNAVGKAISGNDILLIPSTVLNYDGKFLDELTPDELGEITGYKVLLVENPVEIFEKI